MRNVRKPANHRGVVRPAVNGARFTKQASQKKDIGVARRSINPMALGKVAHTEIDCKPQKAR